ncbi:hypothetical protein [Bartonella henselae]|nr:hypothetical protein [Bartonella henselae]
MDWKDTPTFYQTLCKTKTIIRLVLRLLILTGVHTNPWCNIHKD